ncbi:PREDICTED: uncharacterized protein LOC109584703 [Amphimedon queenslandica]|uniref:Uncharacterized protein n=1 Tax=Amphimedon queenslandica TaxID=400682 RepID=A0A1X7U4E5_AMPQE|nr:PREDICTED: uncharacterized protein LOC109584703 [Amphimedon queenslandica]|eukprot:XP_019856094.1 PREDICTED: uncharacterized protein LOC109584703 [Amphimedon queenslandica]
MSEEMIDVKTKSKETSKEDVCDVLQSQYNITEHEIQSVDVLLLSPGHFHVKALQTITNKVKQSKKKPPSGWTVKIVKVPMASATASLPPSLPLRVTCSSILTSSDPILIDVTTYHPNPAWLKIQDNTDNFTETFYSNIKTHINRPIVLKVKKKDSSIECNTYFYGDSVQPVIEVHIRPSNDVGVNDADVEKILEQFDPTWDKYCIYLKAETVNENNVAKTQNAVLPSPRDKPFFMIEATV